MNPVNSLIIPATLVLIAGCLLAFLLRRYISAATRHSIWATALAMAGLAPVLLLVLPRWQVPLGSARFLAGSAALGGSRQSDGFSWMAVLGVVWAAGAAVFLIRILASEWRLARLVRTAEPDEPAAGVAVLIIGAELSPMAVSFPRRAIVLPESSSAWPAEMRASVLAHEQAHLERNDGLWSIVGRLVCSALWFHPLAWLALREMNREAERACDNEVLSAGSKAADYADALIAIARSTMPAPAAALPMTGRHPLEARVEAILNLRENRRRASRSIAMLAAAAFLIPLAAQQQPVYNVGAGVTAPTVLQRITPTYTQEAKDAKIQGKVILSVVIGTDGRAQDILVVQPLGSGLDVAAITAVQQWSFAPGTKDGETVAVRATIEINFSLL
jgi:TonB family protein